MSMYLTFFHAQQLSSSLHVWIVHSAAITPERSAISCASICSSNSSMYARRAQIPQFSA